MATVTFDNGTKVQFDGTPTQADIEEVAKKVSGNAGSSGAPAADPGSIEGGPLGRFFSRTFPNSSVGKVIGTDVLGPLAAAVGGSEAIDGKGGRQGLSGALYALKHYDWNPYVDAKGLAGDATGDAINAASLLAAPETGGTSLLARTGVNAAVGGGLSLANSASNGNSFSDPSTWENAGGAALISSLIPSLVEAPLRSLNRSTKMASGVTPQIENILKGSTPEEVQRYIGTTLAHNGDLTMPTATGLASTELEKAAAKIVEARKAAGSVIGDALKTDGQLPIIDNPTTKTPAIDEVLSNFNKMVEETFGHEVTPLPEDKATLKIAGDTMRMGEVGEPRLEPLSGRSRTVASADSKRLLDIHKQLTDLAEEPTVRKASDTIRNLDDMIDWKQVDAFGVQHDPLNGIIRSIRGDLNGAIRNSSQAMASANDRFSGLKDIENEIGQMAGKTLQRGSLLLRRVFSGDKSAESIKVLNDIKNETGVDLIKHAALARFATENFGDASSKTLLQQALNVEGSLAGGMKRALLAPIKGATKKLIVPDTENYAMRIAGGNKHANMFDELLTSPAGQNLIRTYVGNASAAHPGGGIGVGRSIMNLIGNATAQK